MNEDIYFAFFGAMIGILSLVMTYFAWSNGHWMKQTEGRMDDRTARQTEILARITEGQEDFKKSFTALLERIEQGQENIMKYLGDLIVADGQKTRQAITEIKPS